jgi:cytidylate kinase
MNIIVSGWPGAGTTTLSILLSSILDYKFLDGGSLYKYFAKQIVGADSGDNFLFFENNYGKYWDMLWDKYAVWKINHTDKLLLEAKTAGFFVEDEDVYEIMVIASVQARIQRAEKDGRSQAAFTIEARDKDVRNRWWVERGIDLYSPQQIRDNYDLILDNSTMSINHELDLILKTFEEDYHFPGTDLGVERKKVDSYVSQFQNHGKEYFLADLDKRGLHVTPKQVFADWQKNFADDIKQLPLQMQGVIQKELA